MHQIPPKPDSFRVRIWRALQKSGALQLKNSVYVLPESQDNEAKFSAFVTEISKAGGEAFLCKSQFVMGIDQGELVSLFKKARKEKYDDLANELRLLQKLLQPNKQPSESDLMTIEHSLGRLERQLNEVGAIDFFRTDTEVSARKLLNGILLKIDQLRGGSSIKISRNHAKEFQGKMWVTRSDIRVDRLASAWLINRFIDKKAKYKFVKENNYRPTRNEVRFDMFNGEFTHIGDKCTFEVLAESFALDSVAINAIGDIIHDLDLKDTKFNRPEVAGIGVVLKGIISSEKHDGERIKKANIIFDNLFQIFESQSPKKSTKGNK